MNDAKVASTKPYFFALGIALLIAWFFALPGSAPFSSAVPGPSRPDVKEVSVLEAKALIDAGAIVIDVRDKAVAGRSHLPGALLIPLEVLAAHVPQIEAHKAAPVVVYCGDGSTLGPRATELLNKAGFAHAVNMQPGIQGWRAAGYATAGA
jgi:rhodanese-related sulfurtransferase